MGEARWKVKTQDWIWITKKQIPNIKADTEVVIEEILNPVSTLH